MKLSISLLNGETILTDSIIIIKGKAYFDDKDGNIHECTDGDIVSISLVP